MNRKAVILINVGTPESTSLRSVQKYLSQFLGDKRVLNLPFLVRKLLVNAIIIPFRVSKSRKLYMRLWTEKGSPLLYHSEEIQRKLQTKLGDGYKVYLGMRYGKPSLKEATEQLSKENISEITIIPLFPQYASATTGTAIDQSLKIIRKWNSIPNIQILSQFYNNKQYITAFSAKIKGYLSKSYDHILFSYHGLPLKQVYESHDNIDCSIFKCSKEINHHNQYCYHATCYDTTRLLAQNLGLSSGDYIVCFQSRFSKNWLGPFTDEILVQKARDGAKKILVVSPSFITDCLETIVEIGEEYRQLFLANGGEQLELVESLNADDSIIETLYSLIG